MTLDQAKEYAFKLSRDDPDDGFCVMLDPVADNYRVVRESNLTLVPWLTEVTGFYNGREAA